jgi:hypothetical protein
MTKDQAETRQKKLAKAEKLAQEMQALSDRLNQVSDLLVKELQHGGI